MCGFTISKVIILLNKNMFNSIIIFWVKCKFKLKNRTQVFHLFIQQNSIKKGHLYFTNNSARCDMLSCKYVARCDRFKYVRDELYSLIVFKAFTCLPFFTYGWARALFFSLKSSQGDDIITLTLRVEDCGSCINFFASR